MSWVSSYRVIIKDRRQVKWVNILNSSALVRKRCFFLIVFKHRWEHKASPPPLHRAAYWTELYLLTPSATCHGRRQEKTRVALCLAVQVISFHEWRNIQSSSAALTNDENFDMQHLIEHCPARFSLLHPSVSGLKHQWFVITDCCKFIIGMEIVERRYLGIKNH